MKTKKILSALILIGFMIASCDQNTIQVIGNGRDQLIDNGWKFCKDSSISAEMPEYNDEGWRMVDLPHDWSIEDLPASDTGEKAGPFIKSSIGTTATGYTVGGTAWYRKYFIVDAENKKVVISFDGVYMESDVWVNGKHAGFHPYGYTPFNYDITPYLNKPGEQNVISVKVKNNGKNSRWYSGSGIYRHVWLSVVNPVHIDQWGVFATTPVVNKDSAVVSLQVKIKNESDKDIEAGLLVKLIAPDGNIVETKSISIDLKPGSVTENIQNIVVKNPALWSVNTPDLYKVITEVYEDSLLLSDYNLIIGIRSIDFSSDKGFLLNGEPVELKGGCMHHDNGMLGSATYDRAEERRVEIMKANGFNAIRTSHNPPSKQFLDACDRLGMLVIDEAFDMWERPKNPNDYHLYFKEWHKKDLESMLLRDRNHPGVICWSIGNEINERADTSGYRIAQQLRNNVREYDTTRPITAAICGFWDHPGNGWGKTETAFSFLDVGGYNYQCQEYLNDHKKFPKRIMMGTESFPLEAWKNWKLVEDCPWVIGDFVWTGMDYLGETGIGNAMNISDSEHVSFAQPWPWVNAWCGDIDICGNKKPQMYFRDVVWDNSKLEILVHNPLPDGKKEKVSMWGWPNELPIWNWKGQEGKPMLVSVYTKCSFVRLELNGKTVGEKAISSDSNLTAKFLIPYEPGVLKAVGFSEKKEIVSKTLQTTGAAKCIRLSADRSVIRTDRNDLAYISVEVIDENGFLIQDAKVPFTVSVTGEGELLAAGSACPNEPESYKDVRCITFGGRALIIIRPTGKKGSIHILAESQIPAAAITVQTE